MHETIAIVGGGRLGRALAGALSATGPFGRGHDGAGAAVAGSSARALAFARRLAERLGMRPFEVAAEDRVAYHAGAAMASNFLIALETAAERVAGIDRTL